MTRVDFYVLPEAPGGDGAVVTACKLCDKAVAAGQRVYVHAADGSVVDAFDRALWSFRQGSFITHERYSGGKVEGLEPAVLIGSAEPPASHHQVLINLASEVPDFFSRFDRVLEIVDGDTAQRAQSRNRFKFYRDRGYELNSHNL